MELPAKPRIAFYCGENVQPWGPGSLLDGIGGSEEALIHITRQFRDLGWQAEVYADPRRMDIPTNEGVSWRRCEDIQSSRPGEVFVAWRDSSYVTFGVGWRQVYHWLHNRQEWPYDPEAAALVDRILAVSRDHARDAGFLQVDPAKIYCTFNGLEDSFLRDPGHNEPERAIYASCPARGLVSVLEMWPAIRRAVPAAQLDIYNGFTPVYEAMAEEFPGLLYIKARVLALMDQPGVTFHGMVGQHRLAEGFARAGVWVYPTECNETSCITAMKALAMGCIPVTSGFGALAETLGGRDFGPGHRTRRITHSKFRLWRFRRKVVEVMRNGASPRMQALRLEGARWARETYSWRRIANEWLHLFNEVAARKGLDGQHPAPEPVPPAGAPLLARGRFG